MPAVNFAEVPGHQGQRAVIAYQVHPKANTVVPLGALLWIDKSREIVSVVVLDGVRRYGVATGLLERAQELAGGPLTDDGYRTEEGEAWMDANGLEKKPLVKHVTERDAAIPVNKLLWNWTFQEVEHLERSRLDKEANMKNAAFDDQNMLGTINDYIGRQILRDLKEYMDDFGDGSWSNGDFGREAIEWVTQASSQNDALLRLYAIISNEHYGDWDGWSAVQEFEAEGVAEDGVVPEDYKQKASDMFESAYRREASKKQAERSIFDYVRETHPIEQLHDAVMGIVIRSGSGGVWGDVKRFFNGDLESAVQNALTDEGKLLWMALDDNDEMDDEDFTRAETILRGENRSASADDFRKGLRDGLRVATDLVDPARWEGNDLPEPEAQEIMCRECDWFGSYEAVGYSAGSFAELLPCPQCGSDDLTDDFGSGPTEYADVAPFPEGDDHLDYLLSKRKRHASVSTKDAERVLAAMKKAFRTYFTDTDSEELTDGWVDGGGEKVHFHPEDGIIAWEGGPYQWTYMFPHGGIDEEMTGMMQEFGGGVAEIPDVSDMLDGLYVEAATHYSVSIHPEERTSRKKKASDGDYEAEFRAAVAPLGAGLEHGFDPGDPWSSNMAALFAINDLLADLGGDTNETFNQSPLGSDVDDDNYTMLQEAHGAGYFTVEDLERAERLLDALDDKLRAAGLSH